MDKQKVWWSSAKIEHYKEALAMNKAVDAEKLIVDEIVNKLLPEICRRHVYHSEVQRSMQIIDNGEYVYVSWTFFNDERVRLKARVHRGEEFVYLGIRLEPMCDDFEEWQADAIMRCDAGEDVWERTGVQQELPLGTPTF